MWQEGPERELNPHLPQWEVNAKTKIKKQQNNCALGKYGETLKELEVVSSEEGK